ncbi:hypothetical protein Bbelb_135260 [Branchiostoma belcheri]|nr:hypothetical protein Bbelb_135260 [Branchiostoma belcheri]
MADLLPTASQPCWTYSRPPPNHAQPTADRQPTIADLLPNASRPCYRSTPMNGCGKFGRHNISAMSGLEPGTSWFRVKHHAVAPHDPTVQELKTETCNTQTFAGFLCVTAPIVQLIVHLSLHKDGFLPPDFECPSDMKFYYKGDHYVLPRSSSHTGLQGGLPCT